MEPAASSGPLASGATVVDLAVQSRLLTGS